MDYIFGLFVLVLALHMCEDDSVTKGAQNTYVGMIQSQKVGKMTSNLVAMSALVQKLHF